MTFTLCIALLGLLLSVVSLSWQAWTWRHEGPVIKLSTENHLPTYGDVVGDHLVALHVVNSGRSATTIESWGIRLPEGSSVFQTNQPEWFTRLPYRLEPHSSTDLRIAADDLRGVARRQQVPFSSMNPWVRLGSGDVVRIKGVPLKE